MLIEREVFENGDESSICKVGSINQLLLLPFLAISIAIFKVLIKPLLAMGGGDDDFDGDDKASRVIVKMFAVHLLQSYINTTSEYEPANTIQTVASYLLSPGAFVSLQPRRKLYNQD